MSISLLEKTLGQVQEKLQALDTRLSQTEQATLQNFNGQFLLSPTLSAEVEKFVIKLKTGADISLEDKMKMLASEHEKTLRHESRLKWGINITALMAVITGLVTGVFFAYKHLNNIIEEEKTSLRSKLQENTSKFETEYKGIHEKFEEINNSSRNFEAAISKTQLLNGELEKIAKINPKMMERFRIDIGTYIVLAEHEVEAFLGTPDYKKWITSPPDKEFEAAKAQWTLADGRNIEGSELHRQRGIRTATPPLYKDETEKDIKPAYLTSGATAITLIKINP